MEEPSATDPEGSGFQLNTCRPVWEMKSSYNSVMIYTFWISAFARELHSISDSLWVFRSCTWKPRGSVPSAPLKGSAAPFNRWHGAASATEATPTPSYSADTDFKAFAKALIFKAKSDHRQQILMHSAAETSEILHTEYLSREHLVAPVY